MVQSGHCRNVCEVAQPSVMAWKALSRAPVKSEIAAERLGKHDDRRKGLMADRRT